MKDEIRFYMGAGGLSAGYIDDNTVSRKTTEQEPKLELELPIPFGEPIDLGEAVKIPLSQSAVYGKNSAGDNEQYIAVVGSPAVFYAVHAETGERRFAQELPETDVIWAMAIGSDGNVYLSGTTNGALFRYWPDARRLESLGVNPSDKFVWDLKASADGKLYGATYPNSKVFEFDIALGTFQDLGAMMPGQQYARGLGVTDDYVYVGIGTAAHLVRYDRRTGEKKELAIPTRGESGTISEIQIYGGKLFVNTSRKLYVLDEGTVEHLNTITYQGKISEPSPYQPNLIYYKLADALYTYNMDTNETAPVEGAPPLPGDTAVKYHVWMTLTQGEKAGKTVLAGMAAFTDSFFYDPTDHWYRLMYPEVESQGVPVNAMEAYGDQLYLGGYQRGLSIFDMNTGQYTYTNKGFHQSEGISGYKGKVLFGTYSGAKMYAYNPALPADYNEYGAGNPGLALVIGEEQDRPFTMTEGDGRLFIGTFPSYGKLGGALTIMEEIVSQDGAVVETVHDVYRNIVPNQSVFGLAYKDGKLYGGTSLAGGFGVNPTETEAKLFVFDVAKREKIAEFTPVIPGLGESPQLIGQLIFGQDGLLWGAVDGTLFAMNPDTYEIIKSKVIYPTLYNSSKYRPFYLKWGRDGLLYTTLGRKLTVVDPKTLAAKQLVEETVDLMALGDDGSVYYALGSRMYMLKHQLVQAQTEEGPGNEMKTSTMTSLLESMSLEEKVGQLFTLTNRGTELTERTRRLVAERKVGGIFLDMDSLVNSGQVQSLTAGLQRTALEEGVGIPLFISADFVAGAGCKLQGGAVHFPKNKAIGVAGDLELAYESGKITAAESLAMGVNFNYSPVVDINNNPDNPVIGTHSFGENKELVARLGRAVIEGYQDHGLIATAKHFPGHGDTNVDSHLDLPVLPFDTERLESFELFPFREAIEAGVDAIMVGHIAVPAWDPTLRPASLSKAITTGWLREKLGFQGLIVTDGLSMKGVTAAYTLQEACVLALEAGADILLATGNTPEDEDAMVEAVLTAVKSGRLSRERIDESVARILEAKAKYGLVREKLDMALPEERMKPQDQTHPAYEAVSMKLARKAVTPVNGMRPLFAVEEGAKGWTLLWDRQTDIFRSLLRKELPIDMERRLESYEDAVHALRICGDGPVLLALSHNKLMERKVLSELDRLAGERKNVYLTHFGSGYDLAHIPHIPALLMYDRAPALQAAAVQYLTGKELD